MIRNTIVVHVGMFTGHNCDVSKAVPTVLIPKMFEYKNSKPIMKPGENVSKPIMKLKYNI